MIAALLRLVPSSVWIGLGAAVLAVGGYFWIDHHGYTRGATAVQQKWDAARLATDAQIARFNAESRTREAEHAADLKAIGAQYDKAELEANAQRDHDVAAARAGGVRLRAPGTCIPGPAAPAAPLAGAHRSDGAQTCELSGAVAADLLALADDADRNTKQLGACQAIVSADRQLIGVTP